MITKLEPADFESYEKTLSDPAYKDKLIVVDFYADWCGPCRMISPKLETIVTENDIVGFKINVDDSTEIAEKEGISAMPTFIFYKNGKKVDTLTGASEEKLRGKVNTHK